MSANVELVAKFRAGFAAAQVARARDIELHRDGGGWVVTVRSADGGAAVVFPLPSADEAIACVGFAAPRLVDWSEYE